MFYPGGETTIETGRPIAMHAMVGDAITGRGFRADIRRYHWREKVVSAGRADCAHLLFFRGRRNLQAQSAYRDCAGPPTSLGDIVFIPAHQTLVSRSLPGEQQVLSLLFDGELAPHFDLLEWSPARLARTLDIRAPQIAFAMHQIAREVSCPGFAAETLVEGLALQIAAGLCRHFGAENSRIRDGGARLSAERMRTVVAYLEDAPAAPTLDDLAQACGLSKRHFTRAFRNTTGLSAGEFLAERRLERAKGLLADRRLLIKEVAFRCGFRSTPAFASAFRRATGLTPRDYRLLAH